MKPKHIWFIILILTIIIILSTSYIYARCIINKLYEQDEENLLENLLVSPSKLYSTNDESDKSRTICNVKNKSELKNKQSYINIDMLMKIKNINPQQRLGAELVGYKMRMELPKYNETNITTEHIDNQMYNNKQHIFDYNELVNKELNKNNETKLSDDFEITNDLIIDKNYYHKCSENTCWYDVTVINHIYIKPQNIHKISWTNRFGEQETKWTELHLHNIKVPIMPHIKSISKSDYYYKDIELNASCENYFDKNNTINIPCSSNNECSKYGAYYCNGNGMCETSYINT